VKLFGKLFGKLDIGSIVEKIFEKILRSLLFSHLCIEAQSTEMLPLYICHASTVQLTDVVEYHPYPCESGLAANHTGTLKDSQGWAVRQHVKTELNFEYHPYPR